MYQMAFENRSWKSMDDVIKELTQAEIMSDFNGPEGRLAMHLDEVNKMIEEENLQKQRLKDEREAKKKKQDFLENESLSR